MKALITLLITLSLGQASNDIDESKMPDWLRGSYHASNVPNARKITDEMPKVEVTKEDKERSEYEDWVRKQPKSILDN